MGIYHKKINPNELIKKMLWSLKLAVKEGTATEDDKRHIGELEYLRQCLKEYKAQDTQLNSIESRIGNRI